MIKHKKTWKVTFSRSLKNIIENLEIINFGEISKLCERTLYFASYKMKSNQAAV